MTLIIIPNAPVVNMLQQIFNFLLIRINRTRNSKAPKNHVQTPQGKGVATNISGLGGNK